MRVVWVEESLTQVPVQALSQCGSTKPNSSLSSLTWTVFLIQQTCQWVTITPHC